MEGDAVAKASDKDVGESLVGDCPARRGAANLSVRNEAGWHFLTTMAAVLL